MLQDVFVIASLTLLVMLMPGADMALVARNTLLANRRAGALTALGVLTGNSVHITYCALGVGWLIARSVVAYSVLRYAASAYLIVLGLTTLRATSAPSAALAKPVAVRRGARPFLDGLFNNLLNPKGALFYLSVFTHVIRPDVPAVQRVASVAVMVAVSASFWLAFIHALDMRAVRGILVRAQLGLRCALGAVLILFGIQLAARD